MFDPIRIQRLEGAALLVAAVAAFDAAGWSWWWFAGLLLAPDLSMVGYLVGPRVGAAVYNLGHALVGPAAMIGMWFAGAPSGFLAGGAIWLAHIGMDRAFGYGLKHPDRFEHTHLGMIGKGK
jgi:hypothetical protein